MIHAAHPHPCACSLRPYEKIVEVLLHELTHNRFDEHDDDFKALNSELTKEYRANLDAFRGARATADGPVAAASAEPMDEEADAGRTLGGGDGEAAGRDARAAAAQAAAQRAAAQRAAAQSMCVECDPDEALG